VTIFDPAVLARRLDELNEQLSAPGFWDDPRRAAVVSADQARTQRKLDTYRRLEGEIGDLPTLLEMVGEDDAMLPEADASITALEAEIARLQEQALFSGEYDGGGSESYAGSSSTSTLTPGGGGGSSSTTGQSARNGAQAIGRNDPCPCGSGKKYKRCHGLAA